MKVKLSDRQRKVLARLSRTADLSLAMDRDLAKQLERKRIVRFSLHVYERHEWNEVVARLPIVYSELTREELLALLSE